MMHVSYLRPVGEKISLQARQFEFTSNYQFLGFQSGTMALQAALEAARDSCSRHLKDNATAIIPAYACPDLISACEGAGLKAKLVDTQLDFPLPIAEQLREAVDDATIAVVLPSFLGLKPSPELIQEAKDLGLFVICDFAQSPFSLSPDTSEQADCYIYSFGKGKPVSMLGGGALLLSSKHQYKRQVKQPEEGQLSKLKFRLKVAAYNFVIRPTGYAILMNLFGNKIGQTIYKEPQALEAIDPYRLPLLASNIIAQQTNLQAQGQETLNKLNSLISNSHALKNLTPDKQNVSCKLLRYPALCPDKTMRDLLVHRLNQQGIGATAMYTKALPDLESVPAYVKAQNSITHARDLADRLITLPCHSTIDDKSLELIEAALKQYKEES